MKSNWVNYINFIWTFAVTLRATDLFSLWDNTRKLYMILIVSIRDIGAFMMITTYIMYVFGVIKQFQALINGRNDITLAEQTGLVTAEALGGFEVPGAEEPAETGEWIVFLWLQIITNIVVLNTLIAILGDSYDEVMTCHTTYDMCQKIDLLIELNDLMKKSDIENKLLRTLDQHIRNLVTGGERVGEPQYIIIVKYFTNNSEDNAWDGKIKKILREITKLRTST